jgi:hypothetical protein
MNGSGLEFHGRADALVERAAPIPAEGDGGHFFMAGMFVVECYGADGTLRWKDTARNGCTSVGLDYLLNTAWRGGTAITTWFLGLVDNAGWTGYNLADTMASHSSPNAWAENTDYSNADRPAWGPGAPASNAIVNAATVDFQMTPSSTKTIKGLFCVSSNTKGGTTGTLWATASFTGGTQSVNNGDTLKVSYTVSAANSPLNT